MTTSHWLQQGDKAGKGEETLELQGTHRRSYSPTTHTVYTHIETHSHTYRIHTHTHIKTQTDRHTQRHRDTDRHTHTVHASSQGLSVRAGSFRSSPDVPWNLFPRGEARIEDYLLFPKCSPFPHPQERGTGPRLLYMVPGPKECGLAS